MKDFPLSRRHWVQLLALAGCSIFLRGRVFAKEEPGVIIDRQEKTATRQAPGELRSLRQRLAGAPRPRNFKTVPMILDTPDLWDAEALDVIIAYRGTNKQVCDNTDISGPWLNQMRNSLNVQVFSFQHPDFLAVSATHGSAQLALYDQAMWEKYQLGTMAGGDFKTNRLIQENPVPTDTEAHEDLTSVFGSAGNTIPALQRRGVIFMACHNAVWEHAAELREKGINPDKLSHEAIAAELTNHLIDGVVLTPGMAGTIPELQRAGFHYVK
jgi:intracellular sulfur oxidation DsrE/DsrF family protein